MAQGNAFILTLAYPETIVMVADEWYSKYLRFFGIGKKNYVRAGHAALVLISKSTGELEYHDFGRYITPEPYGRVRGKLTDGELDFPLKAQITNGTMTNLEEILKFLATHPKFTHGEGSLIASVCSSVNYEKARSHIDIMQKKAFIVYAAFKKNACNCARFVTDSLIAGLEDISIKKRLKRSKWFTPSTIGNVVIANTEDKVYRIDPSGYISEFSSTVLKENRRLFLDRLQTHQPNFEGTLQPKDNKEKKNHAQWLSGIAAGAWFELYAKNGAGHYRFRRVSPDGHVDIDAYYSVSDPTFNDEEDYTFVPYSNCLFFYVEQNGKRYRFEQEKQNTAH